ncbi:MAG: TMEM165/GDT1 family protein [Acidobacteriota bacterium]|nr:TMEM165/GDT1 family protein [Acidobacteriota bacterium]MDE3044023.1 TMEM165/GDT1 family protein [Acidobacteriota bacterium]MDE3107633.1 TMEM165/GDT1 family protein [Acidobacteriota bacterium]
MSIGTFLGVMALMFVLELPDKTMIATIVMSTRARPLSIAIGASAGFVVQMGIAVAAGGLLTLLPGRVKDGVVAALFLGGAAYLFFSSEETAEEKGEREATRERRSTVLREIITAFGVIFVGEFGDLTQIQAATLSARTHQPWGVFFAGSIALVVVAFLGSFGGKFLQRYVPLEKIRFVGGLIFLGLGLYTLVQLFTS